MKFLYDKNAGSEILEIKGESFAHLKARRVRVGERLEMRNLSDNYAYIYEITEFNRTAVCELVFKSRGEKNESGLEIAWAVVEPGVIEKTLPSLNEMGVGKIIFVYSDFSQKNVRLDFERFRRILISSCEQSGRTDLLKFEEFKSSDEFLKNYPNAALLDFGGVSLDEFKIISKFEKKSNLDSNSALNLTNLSNLDEISSQNLSQNRGENPAKNFAQIGPLFIGPEGGFSENERAKFKAKFGLNCPNILRSNTAIISAVAKILL